MTTQYRSRNLDYFQYDLLGEIYAAGAERVGKYGFPQLQEEKLIPDGSVVGFNYLLSAENPGKCWYHCFCDDYQFARLWSNLYRYLPLIKRTRGFISTDFSLYRDYSDDALIWNCYRNRVLAYAIQQAGVPMIPTAGFGPESTWKWCFDGLPQNSTVAITTNGTLSDPEARRLFAGGVEALVFTIHPFAIVVCGKSPAWLDTKYPDVQIIHISSYSQIWNKRRCA